MFRSYLNYKLYTPTPTPTTGPPVPRDSRRPTQIGHADRSEVILKISIGYM